MRKTNYKEGYRGAIIQTIRENGFLPLDSLRLYEKPVAIQYQRCVRRLKEEGLIEELRTINKTRYVRFTEEGENLIKEELGGGKYAPYLTEKTKYVLRYLKLESTDKEKRIAYKLQQNKFINDVSSKLYAELCSIYSSDVPDLNVGLVEDDLKAFYDSAKIKSMGSYRAAKINDRYSNKINNSRINGLSISPGGIYSVYNIGKVLPEWRRNGEDKMAACIRMLASRSMRDFSAPNYEKEAVIISANDKNFVRIVTEKEEKDSHRRKLMTIDQAYDHMYALPYTCEGVKMFKIMQLPMWRAKLREQFLTHDEMQESRFAQVSCDGYDIRNRVYKLVFCIPDMTKLKSFVKRAETEGVKDRFYLYCYDHQLPVVTEIVKDHVKVFSVDIDDMCLELDVE